jgi:hypothetical protein
MFSFVSSAIIKSMVQHKRKKEKVKSEIKSEITIFNNDIKLMSINQGSKNKGTTVPMVLRKF